MTELIHFLNPKGQRFDIKTMAMQTMLGMSGSKEGLGIIKELAGETDEIEKNLYRLLMSYLVGLTVPSEQEAINNDAALVLINLTADEELAASCLKFCSGAPNSFVKDIWNKVEDNKSPNADHACMILSNLTHEPKNCSKVFENLTREGISLEKVVSIFCNETYNTKGAQLHYLAPFISNLSQVSDARKQLLDEGNPVTISKLLAFTDYKASLVRRGGVIGTLRNCCFETSSHEWLLREDNGIDILPRLLLPLAGPTPPDMDPEEVDKLPIDLQYLDDDKKVEEDPDLRKMLLEAINQLCATKAGREVVRLKNAYHILKELHKTENDVNVKLACENVVDILIKKEGSGEITVDNFHDVDVPVEMVPELDKMDEEYLKED